MQQHEVTVEAQKDEALQHHSADSHRRPTVMVADDHGLIAEAVSQLLATRYDVICICSSGRRLLVEAAIHKPDLIVLDIGMPELNGIEAARQLARLVPDTRIVFLSQQSDLAYLHAAFATGALGYVSKQASSRQLLTAVDAALANETYISPELRQSLPHGFPERMHLHNALFGGELTQRQREVLQLVAEGKTVKEISSALNISPKTVEFHKRALMNQTGLRTTAELTRYALSHGIVAA